MRASFGASTSATVVVPRSPRLRFVVLLLRMCCLNACPRRNFPFFVRLKRFAAPRWAFSLVFFPFAIGFLSALRRSRRRGFGLAPALWPPAENRVHLVAFETRHRLGDGQIRELLHEALENAAADFRMRHLAAPEEDRRLYF